MLDDFAAKVPQSAYSNPGSINFPDINNYLAKYQDPRHADNIMRVQAELDETKIILVCEETFDHYIQPTTYLLAQDHGIRLAAWREAR